MGVRGAALDSVGDQSSLALALAQLLTWPHAFKRLLEILLFH